LEAERATRAAEDAEAADEQATRAVALKAEQKAVRDARYAARKARAKKIASHKGGESLSSRRQRRRPEFIEYPSKQPNAGSQLRSLVGMLTSRSDARSTRCRPNRSGAGERTSAAEFGCSRPSYVRSSGPKGSRWETCAAGPSNLDFG
jgi:hypothetical protein